MESRIHLSLEVKTKKYNELLHLPEVKVIHVDIEECHATIELEPMEHVQPCPCCHSSSVIRNGTPYKRNICHLATFDKSVDLLIPAIYLACKDFGATFSVCFSFGPFVATLCILDLLYNYPCSRAKNTV